MIKEAIMSLKTLAEAIIVRAAEDFLSENRHEEDIAFFSGEGFRICSEMAGMNHSEKCAFLDLISKCAPVSYSEKRMAAGAGGMKSLQI
jgi:hypothetical protein